MNKQKSTILFTTYYLKAWILFSCLLIFFAACNNSETKSKQTNTEVKEINPSLKDTVSIDSTLHTEKQDTLTKTTPKLFSTHVIKKERQQRFGEGISDAKLNGEPILLQEELSENILASNPDTIKNYLKGIYLGQERNFPRSIADNFEHGISTEHISYPKLNFRVELFEDEYSKKPYKVLGYSVRKENEKIIVE